METIASKSQMAETMSSSQTTGKTRATLCWTDTQTSVQLWQQGLAVSETTVWLLSSGSHADEGIDRQVKAESHTEKKQGTLTKR